MTRKVIILAISILTSLVTLPCRADGPSPLTADELQKIAKDDRGFDDYAKRVIIAGPAIISLNGIAELNLPEGYIYAENKITYNKPPQTRLEQTCNRYLALRGASENRLCIKISDVGYLRLSDELFLLKDQAEQLQRKVPPKAFWHFPETINFNWLQKPTYNKQNHTLSWAYHYIYDNKTIKNQRPESFVDQEISMVMFGQRHIIWLVNGSYDSAEKFQPQLADWVQRITFYDQFKYQEDKAPTCYGLAPGDSALGGNAYDYYADPQRCFPYPIEYLIIDLPNSNDGNDNISRFLSTRRNLVWTKITPRG
ncbi:hypothetical protein PGR10_22310 [Klebsiella sp. 141198]|uniref:hypothetical protein n=1 Tax=Klebsiella sp. 141198 TaxID=3020036 RepID=UPI003D32FC3C